MIKKRLIIILYVILLFWPLYTGVSTALQIFQIPVIGTVTGAENDYIKIDGVTYIKASSSAYSSPGRGRYIGSVKNGDIVMRVYKAKGDSERNYLYTLWGWEGDFYVRQN